MPTSLGRVVNVLPEPPMSSREEEVAIVPVRARRDASVSGALIRDFEGRSGAYL